MAYTIIPKVKYKTTHWSGGTTTELFIHPQNADFSSGNFNVRCSIATVNTEESTFTSLEGVSRTLMVLKGRIELNHEGHHKVKLTPFEQDSFEGDWKTKSVGKVTDFNLMTKNSRESKLTYSTAQTLDITGNNEVEFVHVLTGSLLIDDKRIEVGDSIAFSGKEAHKIEATESASYAHALVVAKK